MSQVEVEDAIQTLETAGLNPSIRLIRQKIGRGSLSTIATHKRAVDAERQADPGPALPDPVVKSLMNGASAYWQELVDAAEAQITEHQDKTDAAYATLREARDAAQAEADDLRAALAELKVEHSELARMASTRTEAIAEQKTLLVAAKGARDEQERANRFLASELGDVRAALAESQRRNEERGAEVARLEERLASRTVQLEKLQGEVQERAGDRRALNEALDDLRQAHRADQKALQEAQATVRTRDDELAALKARDAGALDATRRLESELQALQQERESADAVHAAQLEERDKRLKDLQSALNDAQVVNRLLAKQHGRQKAEAAAGQGDSEAPSD
ncbi:MAG: DNA-binding protein [Pseudomonadota bacterium]